MIRNFLILASITIATLAGMGIASLFRMTTYDACIGGVAKSAVWLVEHNRTTNAPDIDTLLAVSCKV